LSALNLSFLHLGTSAGIDSGGVQTATVVDALSGGSAALHPTGSLKRSSDAQVEHQQDDVGNYEEEDGGGDNERLPARLRVIERRAYFSKVI